jgi:subtilisin
MRARRAVAPGTVLLLAFLAVLALPVVSASPATARGELRLSGLATGAVIPGSYLVTLGSGDPDAVAAEHAVFGVVVERVLHDALRGYTARMSEATARRVAADPRVRRVTRDRVVRSASQGTPTGVERIHAAASSAHASGAHHAVNADIAVLDTGVDLKHPDLDVAGGVDCVPGTDSYDDQRGHGTHIAGIVAAKDNGFGVVGVAPGARIWAVRVLDAAGDGSLATLTCGIDWVTAHASIIEVANMSLIGVDTDRGCGDAGLHEAICKSVAAGVVYTVAAGNDATDSSHFSPASFPEVITVGALADYDGKPGGLAGEPKDCPGGPDDGFASFSNYGPNVALIAPGVCIRSTWMNSGYATLTGTSQAAAHVAGAVALYRAAHPLATPAQVRAALIAASSKDWLSASAPDHRAYGLLDVSSF